MVEQVEGPVKTLGYPAAYWHSAERKGYSSVATFCATEPVAYKKGLGIAEYDREGRVLITSHGHFDLYNIYFPNGGAREERHHFKQKFLKDLHEHLQERVKKGDKLIVVGDYNIAHTEMDIYDPKRLSKESGFLPEEREWMSTYLNSGFVDTYRYMHPNDAAVYSWWSYRELARISNGGWRIDYICITENLKANLKFASVMGDITGSDHCPVMVEMEF